MTPMTPMTPVTLFSVFRKNVGKTFENRNGDVVSLQHQIKTHHVAKNNAPCIEAQRSKVQMQT